MPIEKTPMTNRRNLSAATPFLRPEYPRLNILTSLRPHPRAPESDLRVSASAEQIWMPAFAGMTKWKMAADSNHQPT